MWFNLGAALRRNILCVVHVDNPNVLVDMCGQRWQLCRRHRHDGTSGRCKRGGVGGTVYGVQLDNKSCVVGVVAGRCVACGVTKNWRLAAVFM